MVRLTDGMNAWSGLSPLRATHSVYSYFLDTEYADCIVAQGSGVYLGKTPLDMREYLAEALHRTLADIPVGSGVGSAAFLAEQVAGL